MGTKWERAAPAGCLFHSLPNSVSFLSFCVTSNHRFLWSNGWLWLYACLYTDVQLGGRPLGARTSVMLWTPQPLSHHAATGAQRWDHQTTAEHGRTAHSNAYLVPFQEPWLKFDLSKLLV